MSNPSQEAPDTDTRKGKRLARHHGRSYLELFRQPGDFTAFVLARHSMAMMRLVVRADNADQAAEIARARIDRAGHDARQYDVIMTVPGIVGQGSELGDRS
jgi:hypothetical protein